MNTPENDGEEPHENSEAEQYPGHLPGKRVEDRDEDGKHLRVVARTPHQASEARIAAIGKTVADVNGQYPADDPVYVCVYESTLDERFGAKWQDWNGTYLAFMVGNYALQTYSFPGSRLAEAEARPQEKWDAAAEGDE